MRRFMVFWWATIGSVMPCVAQNDTVFYQASSGNYVVRYLGHFRMVAGPQGSRPYDGETPLSVGERVIVKDSLIEVIIEPATKIHPAVACEVVKVDESPKFAYSYRITNGIKSVQRLNDFAVDFGKSFDVTDITPLDGWHSIRENETDGETIAPGFRWHWFGDIGLGQGNSWIVGVLGSNGYPGIRNSYLAGKVNEPIFAGEGPSSKVDAQITELFAFPANSVSVRTISPSILPSTILMLAYLDTLLSYTRQSVELGWLASKVSKHGVERDDDCDNDEHPDNGIAGNIERRLGIAKRILAKEDSVGARRELQTLLRKVERVWKRSQDMDRKRGRDRREEKRDKDDRVIMTSEAYALLRYNLEYVIDQLPERTRKEREQKREEKK